MIRETLLLNAKRGRVFFSQQILFLLSFFYVSISLDSLATGSSLEYVPVSPQRKRTYSNLKASVYVRGLAPERRQMPLCVACKPDRGATTNTFWCRPLGYLRQNERSRMPWYKSGRLNQRSTELRPRFPCSSQKGKGLKIKPRVFAFYFWVKVSFYGFNAFGRVLRSFTFLVTGLSNSFSTNQTLRVCRNLSSCA